MATNTGADHIVQSYTDELTALAQLIDLGCSQAMGQAPAVSRPAVGVDDVAEVLEERHVAKLAEFLRVGDGVAWVHGLRTAGYSEVLQIESADGIVEAFALNTQY